MRGRDLVIGLLATGGFVTILRLTADGPAGDAKPVPAALSAPAPAPAPAAVTLPAPGPEPTAAPHEISVLTLLHEMTDLDHLARLPTARFAAGQAASTDRRSRRPEDADGWFANDDFVTETQQNLVRVEVAPGGGKRYVLFDGSGPGAIVRLWTATPTGTLRILIDEDPQPALEAPMAALLAGETPPFVPPLAEVTARGYNLYFPFPYRHRCVVTVDDIVSADPFTGQPMTKFYFQIGYRTYGPKDAPAVRPYSAAEVRRAGGAVARAAAGLRDGLPTASPQPGRSAVAIATMAVERGQPSVTSFVAPRGGGQVTELRLVTGERAADKLRTTWLSITFDGEETVRAPLIIFFGTGPTLNPYTSLPMTVGADGGLVCRFRMPFRREAVLSVSRAGPGAVEVGGQITVDAAAFDRDTLVFHAGWRPRALIATRPFRDWHVATVSGVGHQVGTVLDVENPRGVAWWGEGDEKITVDGASFPSLFGTGTEDYFGYAWSQTDTFAHAYHAQTLAPAAEFGGLFSMNRFLILDPIPFERSLRFDLEIWHWSNTTIAADALLYWYARPGGRDDFPRDALPPDALRRDN